jgi:tRNA-dihydrouridine synthase B
MSRYSYLQYREFMMRFGACMCVTEMVSDSGIVHGDRRTMPYLETGDDHPVAVQIFGDDPELMGRAAARVLEVNPSVDAIDVNMGCPVEKVVRRGAGSSLMKDPALCGRIMAAVKASVDVPVTAKIRLGWSSGSITFREVISELESAGADGIGLHVRTRAEKYAGMPHYDLVGNLRDEMSVPLMISGNIYTPEDARRAMEITGADAVMVARGAVGNPALISRTDSMLRTGELPEEPTVSQQADWCLELARMTIAAEGEERGCKIMRSIAANFMTGVKYSHQVRLELTRISTYAELESILSRVCEARGDERITAHGRGILRIGPCRCTPRSSPRGRGRSPLAFRASPAWRPTARGPPPPAGG